MINVSKLGHTKIRSVYSKLLFVILYIAAITLFDAYSYGIIYQEKIQKGNYHHPVWSWVFRESTPSEQESGKESQSEHITVPRYRAIQKILEIGGILVVLFYCGLWPAIGLVISHYLLTYDLLFYLILNPGFIKVMESSVNPYWLQNWYQIGFFIFNPFRSLYFYIFGFAGLTIALLSCFLPAKKA